MLINKKLILLRILTLIMILSSIMLAILGLTLKSSKAEEVVNAEIDSFDIMEGASIRVNNPSGIRFSTKVNKVYLNNLQEGYSFGTLIIPKDLLGENELSKDTPDVTNIAQNVWGKDVDGYAVFNAVLYDIPISADGRVFVARSYIKKADGTYTYSNSVAERSIGEVARYYVDLGDESDPELLKFAKEHLTQYRIRAVSDNHSFGYVLDSDGNEFKDSILVNKNPAVSVSVNGNELMVGDYKFISRPRAINNNVFYEFEKWDYEGNSIVSDTVFTAKFKAVTMDKTKDIYVKYQNDKIEINLKDSGINLTNDSKCYNIKDRVRKEVSINANGEISDFLTAGVNNYLVTDGNSNYSVKVISYTREVSSGAEFSQLFKDIQSSPASEKVFVNEYIVLKNDIVLTGEDKNVTAVDYEHGFNGVIDGRGFSVLGAVVETGLFRRIVGGVIKNIAFLDMVTKYYGLMCDTNQGGIIENVYIQGYICYSNKVNNGGIIGYNAGGRIRNIVANLSYFTDMLNIDNSITIPSNNNYGLIAYVQDSNSVVENCYIVNNEGAMNQLQSGIIPASWTNIKIDSTESNLLNEADISSFEGFWKIEDGKLPILESVKYYLVDKVVDNDIQIVMPKSQEGITLDLANTELRAKTVEKVGLINSKSIFAPISDSLTIEPYYLISSNIVFAIKCNDGVYMVRALCYDLGISNGNQFKEFLQSIIDGSSDIKLRWDYQAIYYNKTVVLLNDIDLTGIELPELAYVDGNSKTFAGTFDGLNHTIKNATVGVNGIFGFSFMGGFKNVTFENIHSQGAILTNYLSGANIENIVLSYCSQNAKATAYCGLFNLIDALEGYEPSVNNIKETLITKIEKEFFVDLTKESFVANFDETDLFDKTVLWIKLGANDVEFSDDEAFTIKTNGLTSAVKSLVVKTSDDLYFEICLYVADKAIYTAQDFLNLVDEISRIDSKENGIPHDCTVRDGEYKGLYKNKIVALANDICLTGYYSTMSKPAYPNVFAGTFDGRGYSITGYFYWDGDGLFGFAFAGTLKNITFDDIDVENGLVAKWSLYATYENVTIYTNCASSNCAEHGLLTGDIDNKSTFINVNVIPKP